MATSLVMLFKIVLFYSLLYWLIPARFIRFPEEAEGFLDRLFISLIHSNFIIIIIVHCLAFLKLYETFSLYFVYIVLIIYLRLKGRSLREFHKALNQKYMIRLFDTLEGRTNYQEQFKLGVKNWSRDYIARARQGLITSLHEPFNGLFVSIILIGAAYIRFKHSLEHWYFGASDSYLHLAWAKYLGVSQIYRDGIYPYGYQAIISALNKTFLADPYFVIRYIGPIAGFLMVLSLYYVVRKSFPNGYLAWVALLIYGVVIDSNYPSGVWRQMFALPMEYGSIFFLPGLYFFNLYCRTGKYYFLLLTGECVALTLLIHPYATVFLGLGCLVIFILYPARIKAWGDLWRTGLVMMASIATGILPLVIGVLLGIPFHGSLGYIQRSAKLPGETLTGNASPPSLGFSENNPYLLLLVVGLGFAVLLVILTIVWPKRKEYIGKIRTNLSFIILTVLLYLLYRADVLGLPVLMDQDRIGMYLAMLMAIIYAMFLNYPDFILGKGKKANTVKGLICVFIVGLIVTTTTFQIPTGNKYEYDETVQIFYEIKSNFENWTIVSPVEQYQQSLGYGWHYEIWEFAQKISERKQSRLTIPTDNVFFIVEKVPLNSGKRVGEPLQPFGSIDKSADLRQILYINPENRYNIENITYHWAEEYLQKNDKLKVYLENDVLIVYLLEQKGINPENLLK